MRLPCKNKMFNRFLIVGTFLLITSVFYKSLFCNDSKIESVESDCADRIQVQQKEIISHLNRIEYKLKKRNL
jgi:hypothetical protein